MVATRTGIVEGVGKTAVMVAAARAMETHRVDGLIRDEYAEHFVRSVPGAETWPTREADIPDGENNPLWGRLGRYFGLRARAFDDFLVRAAGDGVRQVVLLAAGLDTRAHRLHWPGGLRLFELDQQDVLAFKRDVLGRLGVRFARHGHRHIGVDLRERWTNELLSAGFDPGEPSAWLAEGLLVYLPAQAEAELIDTVHRLAAPGSSLAFDVRLDRTARMVRQSPVYATSKEEIDVDLLDLFHQGPTADSIGRLAALDWSVTSRTVFDVARHYGRGPRPEANDTLAGIRLVFAERDASR